MNKFHRTLATSLLLGGVLLAGSAQAAPVVRAIKLFGTWEVPANASTASGSGTITVDAVANTVAWDINQNVVGANGAHIHGPAAAGFNASIIRPLNGGTVPGHMVGSYVIGRTPIDTLGQILHDSTYVNIHSGTFPGGEIRGQILIANNPLPSLSEWGIILLSLSLAVAGGVYLMRRRRSLA